MGNRLNRLFSTLPLILVLALSLTLTVLIMAADFLVGPQVSLAIFYLVPVSFTAWYGRLGAAALLSVLCSALTVWIATQAAQATSILLWNGFAHLGFFLVVAKLLATLKAVLDGERKASRTDYLTGVLNRRALFEQLEFVLNMSRRQRSPLTLAYIDLDAFKQINDADGHETGDKALRFVADTLVKYRRRTDLIGRLGGDEFAIILPDTDHHAARALLADLNEQMRDASDFQREITCSVGVVTFLVMPGDVKEAIRIADDCMYGSKQRGGSGVSFIVYDKRPRVPL